jgi:hypothetical protein
MSMFKTTSADFFQLVFAYFCVFFCVRFVCGSEHLWISTVIRGSSVGSWQNGAGEQEQYILCVLMSQKVAKHMDTQNILTYGHTEYIDIWTHRICVSNSWTRIC